MTRYSHVINQGIVDDYRCPDGSKTRQTIGEMYRTRRVEEIREHYVQEQDAHAVRKWVA